MAIFSGLLSEYNNDDLKKIFKDSFDSEVWKFMKKSEIVTYFYADYKNIGELLLFLKKLEAAYDIALPLTISNKYS